MYTHMIHITIFADGQPFRPPLVMQRMVHFQEREHFYWISVHFLVVWYECCGTWTVIWIYQLCYVFFSRNCEICVEKIPQQDFSMKPVLYYCAIRDTCVRILGFLMAAQLLFLYCNSLYWIQYESVFAGPQSRKQGAEHTENNVILVTARFLITAQLLFLQL